MVSSNHFAQLSAEKFSFYPVNFTLVDQLPADEKERIQELMETNDVTETPSLLFLDAVSLECKHLHHGYQDLEEAVIVKRISSKLE